MSFSKLLIVSGMILFPLSSILNAASLVTVSMEDRLAVEFGVGFEKVEEVRTIHEGQTIVNKTKYKSSEGDVIVWLHNGDEVPYTEDTLTVVKIRTDAFAGGNKKLHLDVTDTDSASSTLYFYTYNAETDAASIEPKNAGSSSDAHVALIKAWGRKNLLSEWHID